MPDTSFTSSSMNQGKAFLDKKKKTTTEGFATSDPFASSSSKSSTSSYNSMMKGMDQSIQATSDATKMSGAVVGKNKMDMASSITAFDTQWEQYSASQNDMIATATTYFNAIENNPLLGQNVQFNDVDGNWGNGYINMQGVLKIYLTQQDMTAIQYINNCGVGNELGMIEGNLSFALTSYYSNPRAYVGTIVTTTTPNVLIGSPMVIGMECGLEGSNVYVNTLSNNPTALYYGAYTDSPETPAMEFLQNGAAVFTYQDCLDAAANTGSTMFALQGVNPANKDEQLAQCALGSDSISASQYGAVSGNCNQGTDGYSYGSGNTISWYSSGEAEYMGVFTDVAGQPAMTAVGNGSNSYNYNSCLQAAKDQGATYFALEDAKNGGPSAKCNVSSDYGALSQYGSAAESAQKEVFGKHYGVGYNNAVYYMPSQNGGIGCYNAIGPDGQPGNGWQEQPGGAEYSYNLCYQKAATQNSLYFGLGDMTDNGSSTTGTCYLSNSEAEIQQFGPAAATVVQADGATYGVAGVNALYEMNSGGNPDFIGNVGRVDEDGMLMTYPNGMYMVPLLDNSFNDTSAATATTSVIPQTPQPVITVDLPNCGGVQGAPVAIDSVSWARYENGGEMTQNTACGLSEYLNRGEMVTNKEQTYLDAIYKSIQSSTKSMGDYLGGSSSSEPFSDMKLVREGDEGFTDGSFSLATFEADGGILGILQNNEAVLADAKLLEKQMAMEKDEMTLGLENITTNSDISFVQQKTTFYLWAFIAFLFFLFTSILFGKVVIMGENDAAASASSSSTFLTPMSGGGGSSRGRRNSRRNSGKFSSR